MPTPTFQAVPGPKLHKEQVDMTFWIDLWKFFLIAGVTLFAGMSVWVILAGFRDIRRMCSRLGTAHNEGTEQ